MSFPKVFIVMIMSLASFAYQSSFAKNWRSVRDSNGADVCAAANVHPLDEHQATAVDVVRCAGLCSVRTGCNYFSHFSTASKCQLFSIDPSQTAFGQIDDCKGYSLTKVIPSSFTRTEPQNVAILSGKSGLLSCRTPSSSLITWNFYPAGNPSVSLRLVENCQVVGAFAADYAVDRTDSGCHLVVGSASVAEGGSYECYDSVENSRRSAQLIVIESDPLCSSNAINGTVAVCSWLEVVCVANISENAQLATTCYDQFNSSIGRSSSSSAAGSWAIQVTNGTNLQPLSCSVSINVSSASPPSPPPSTIEASNVLNYTLRWTATVKVVSPPYNNTVRLVSSSSSSSCVVQDEGRLEVYHNGIWGTVCNDLFTETNAQVACSKLGFGRIGRFIGSSYGPGPGPIWLDNVKCFGNESDIANCAHVPWNNSDCTHVEDVSLRCRDYQQFDIRLANANVMYQWLEARIEILYNGTWGTICANSFSDSTAAIVCFSLGFGRTGTSAYNSRGPGVGQIWLSDVVCSGTEPNIVSCSRSNWGASTCQHSKDVSIRCFI